jgi:hypothetical protein
MRVISRIDIKNNYVIISISEEKFFNTIDEFRSPHLWKKNKKDKWELRNTIY